MLHYTPCFCALYHRILPIRNNSQDYKQSQINVIKLKILYFSLKIAFSNCQLIKDEVCEISSKVECKQVVENQCQEVLVELDCSAEQKTSQVQSQMSLQELVIMFFNTDFTNKLIRLLVGWLLHLMIKVIRSL